MLSGMLQIDPDSRFTAKQVLDHSFFTEPQLNWFYKSLFMKKNLIQLIYNITSLKLSVWVW